MSSKGEVLHNPEECPTKVSSKGKVSALFTAPFELSWIPFENKSCGSAWCKPRRKRNFLGTKLPAATSLHGHIFVKSQRGSGQPSCRTRTQIASIKLQLFFQTPIRRKEIIPNEDQVTEGCTGRGQAEMSLESLTQLDPSHSLPLMFNMFDPKRCLGLI